MAGLLLAVVRDGAAATEGVLVEILVWVVVIALVELMPVPMWRGTIISMGFPLLMVVAFLYEPPAAAAAAFLAASDPRELHRQVGLLRALFNRSQALRVGAEQCSTRCVAESSPPLELLLAAAWQRLSTMR
jgi:hypothetical protein